MQNCKTYDNVWRTLTVSLMLSIICFFVSSSCRSSEEVPPKVCTYLRISSSSISCTGKLRMWRNASDCQHQTKRIRCCIYYTLNNILIKNWFSKKVSWFSVSKIQWLISLTSTENTSWKGLVDCVCWKYWLWVSQVLSRSETSTEK